MSKTWNHPQLGTFQYDEDQDGWIGTCRLPAFNEFNWEAESTDTDGERELLFASAEGRQPSAGAADLALKVIANQAGLPLLVLSALWEEFNGRGPKSGMWWYGDLTQVAENLSYD